MTKFSGSHRGSLVIGRIVMIATVATAALTAFVACGEKQNTETAKPQLTQAELVERGRFLVKQLDCGTCHSPKVMTEQGPIEDHNRLLAGHPSEQGAMQWPKEIISKGVWIANTNAHFTAWSGPWGISYAMNLTPDSATGLGAWTEAQFVKALRNGMHQGEGRPILPPMPWQSFGATPDEDLHAIFAYLRSLPPISNPIPQPTPPAAG